MEAEITAGRRLAEDLGWSAEVLQAETDPPDIVIVRDDGVRVGAEVTRWDRVSHKSIELIDDQILRRAWQRYKHPVGSLVIVQPVPRIGRNAPQFDACDIPGLAEALLRLLKDWEQGPHEDDRKIEVPADEPLGSLWKSILVSRYDDSWARKVYAERTGDGGEGATLTFEQYASRCWRLFVARPVLADPSPAGTDDAQRLGDQIAKKSAGLVRWATAVDERWLLVTANELDSVKLWNFRWLDPHVAPELRASLPPHDFDAIAFVPVVGFDRFKSIVLRR